MNKICSKQDCYLVGIEQDINNFYFDKNKLQYISQCKNCRSKYKKFWKDKNKDLISIKDKNYRENNKDKIKQWKLSNKDRIINLNKNLYDKNKKQILSVQKNYRLENKDKILDYQKKYRKYRRIVDPSFRLRNNISRNINRSITKNGISCVKYLSYTMEELKIHLKSLFESWMTWDNQGKYNPKTWDDNDSSTWTWQIDHIIPQYRLPYVSMEDGNFKKCWALENLRPLSAKQNLLDGVNRIR